MGAPARRQARAGSCSIGKGRRSERSILERGLARQVKVVQIGWLLSLGASRTRTTQIFLPNLPMQYTCTVERSRAQLGVRDGILKRYARSMRIFTRLALIIMTLRRLTTITFYCWPLMYTLVLWHLY